MHTRKTSAVRCDVGAPGGSGQELCSSALYKLQMIQGGKSKSTISISDLVSLLIKTDSNQTVGMEIQ